MTFKATSQPIDVAKVRQLAKLEGDMLARKEKRDRELEAILRGQDDRILLVIGPCSSDNEEAVLEYAKRLSALQEEVKDRIFKFRAFEIFYAYFFIIYQCQIPRLLGHL